MLPLSNTAVHRPATAGPLCPLSFYYGTLRPGDGQR